MDETTRIGGGAVNPNPGPTWKAVGTGDFDGDGKSDILWQNTDGQAAIWLIKAIPDEQTGAA
jgi:serralysin